MSSLVQVPLTSGSTRGALLDLDVLVLILSYVNNHRDVATFMRSSQICYQIGDRVLLEKFPIAMAVSERKWHLTPQHLSKFNVNSESTIFLSSFAKVEAFARYLLSEDHPQRPGFVKELVIASSKPFPSTCAGMIVEVLKKCTHLERLILPGAEELVEANEYFIDAICGLTSIKHLAVHLIGCQAQTLVKKIQSPVQSLIVDLHPFQSGPFEYNPSEDFSAFRSTLQTLRMPWPSSVDGDHADRWFPPVPLKTYPFLTSLEVFGDHPCTMDVLVRMFPNVKHLSVRHRRLMMEHEPSSLRAENIGLQAGLATRWDSLESLEGIMTFVYALAIPCPVRSLRLINSFDCSGSEDAQRFYDTVTVAAPSNLMIAVSSDMLLEPRLIETIQTAKWNQLCISINMQHHEALEDSMANLTAFLRGVIALYLEVSFIWGRIGDHGGDHKGSDDDDDGQNDGDEEDDEEADDDSDGPPPYLPLDPKLRTIYDAADLSSLGPQLSSVVSSATELCVAKGLFKSRFEVWDRYLVEDDSLKWHVRRTEDGSSSSIVLAKDITLLWTDPYKGWYAEHDDDD